MKHLVNKIKHLMEEKSNEDNGENESIGEDTSNATDSNRESTINITTPEQIAVLSNLHATMRTLINQIEIDDYIRSLVKAMIVVTPSTYPMDRIFNIIMDKINHIEPFCEDLIPKFDGETYRFNAYGLAESTRRTWVERLYNLMLTSYIRRETVDLNGCIISWTEEHVESWYSRIMERGQYIDRGNCIVSTRDRYIYSQWEDEYRGDIWGNCLNTVTVEEYEDRYVEHYPKWEKHIFMTYNRYGVKCQDTGYRMSGVDKRIIYKRDLWRRRTPYHSVQSDTLGDSCIPQI